VLLHYPDNLVASYNATLKLISNNPYTFALQDAFRVDYLGKRHGDSYDTNSGQLYMHNLQVKSGGSTMSSSAAVLQFNSSSGGYELKAFK